MTMKAQNMLREFTVLEEQILILVDVEKLFSDVDLAEVTGF